MYRDNLTCHFTSLYISHCTLYTVQCSQNGIPFGNFPQYNPSRCCGSLLPHVHSPRDLHGPSALAVLRTACSPATLNILPTTRRRSLTQHPVLYRPSQSPKYESRRKIGPGSKPVRPFFSASRARQGWCGQLTRHLR